MFTQLLNILDELSSFLIYLDLLDVGDINTFLKQKVKLVNVTTRTDDIMSEFGGFLDVGEVLLGEVLAVEEFAVGLLETDEDGEFEEGDEC